MYLPGEGYGIQNGTVTLPRQVHLQQNKAVVRPILLLTRRFPLNILLTIPNSFICTRRYRTKRPNPGRQALRKMGHKGRLEGKNYAQRQLSLMWRQLRWRERNRNGTDACHDFTKVSFFRSALPLQWLQQKYIHFIFHLSSLFVSSPFTPQEFDINFESLEV